MIARMFPCCFISCSIRSKLKFLSSQLLTKLPQLLSRNRINRPRRRRSYLTIRQEHSIVWCELWVKSGHHLRACALVDRLPALFELVQHALGYRVEHWLRTVRVYSAWVWGEAIDAVFGELLVEIDGEEYVLCEYQLLLHLLFYGRQAYGCL